MSQVCFDSNAFYTVLIITSLIFVYTLNQPYNQYKTIKQYETIKQYKTNKQYKTHPHKPERVEKIIINKIFNDDRNTELQRFINPMIPPLRRGPMNLSCLRRYRNHNHTQIPFNQMGYLHNIENNDQAMPLMGRMLHSQQYEYYTFHHNNPEIKIPIKISGDKEILDDEMVKLENYPNTFKAKIYELDTLRYVPY